MSIFSKLKAFAQGMIGNFSLLSAPGTVHTALTPVTSRSNWLTHFVHQHRQVGYVWSRKSERSDEEVQELKLKAQARREARAYKRALAHDYATVRQPISSTYRAMLGDYYAKS